MHSTKKVVLFTHRQPPSKWWQGQLEPEQSSERRAVSRRIAAVCPLLISQVCELSRSKQRACLYSNPLGKACYELDKDTVPSQQLPMGSGNFGVKSQTGLEQTPVSCEDLDWLEPLLILPFEGPPPGCCGAVPRGRATF